MQHGVSGPLHLNKMLILRRKQCFGERKRELQGVVGRAEESERKQRKRMGVVEAEQAVNGRDETVSAASEWS